MDIGPVSGKSEKVNLKVDTTAIRLVEIPEVGPEWESEHKIRALAVGGRAPAIDFLVQLKRDHRDDYKRILKVMRLVGTQTRVRNENHVKRGKQHREIYEMRAHKGHARLLFFYAQAAVVICTHGFRKAKESAAAEQNREFEKCELLRKRYLNWIAAGEVT
jgi:phage-related protein